jgi:hypothetical protein
MKEMLMHTRRNQNENKQKKRSSEKESEAKEKQPMQRTQFSEKIEPLKETSEIEEGIQVERRKAYVEPLNRQVLRNLIESGEEGEIIPSYHPASGFIYEEKNSQRTDKSQRYSRDFLEKLLQLDILKKSFYYSISICPNCESPAVTLHPSCPKCKSHHIDKINLTEHIPCGYIDQKTKYKQDICPKCGKKLVEGEYRNMGRWYLCRACGEKIEHPQFNLLCRECNNNFTVEEAKVLEVPKFTLNPKRKQEIRQNVVSLENISKLLSDLGFKIEMPGSATGRKSGMEYHFSILAKKQTNGKENVIAVDHEVAESEIQAQPLILYVYKISEIEVDLPIFIALPKLSETAKKIAKAHGILTIEGPPEGNERIAEIKAEIESRINIAQNEQKPNNESIIERTAEVVANPVVPSKEKQKVTPLIGVLRKLRLNKDFFEPTVENSPSETQVRNIALLLDVSSSMRKGKGNVSNFDLASRAIENILRNPDPVSRNDLLSIIIFWDEIIRGFQKEILYENVSTSSYVDPQKLSQIEPKKIAGTPLWEAVEFAMDFLQDKEGNKIIKLVTDAVSTPSPKNGTMTRLEENQTQLDCIVIGSKGNVTLGNAIKNYKLGRFFESSSVESLALALKA